MKTRTYEVLLLYALTDRLTISEVKQLSVRSVYGWVTAKWNFRMEALNTTYKVDLDCLQLWKQTIKYSKRRIKTTSN